jgi:septum formation protein
LPKTNELHVQFLLASSSSIRYRLLTNAGYLVKAIAPNIDEERIRSISRGMLRSPNETAAKLAKEKALIILKNYPRMCVLAADQILTCDGHWFSKPLNYDSARKQLSCLSGKRHILHTSVCIVSAVTQLWIHTDNSYLTMRDLSADFISRYLCSIGPGGFNSAGCYQLENQGSQLFDCIEGDFFSILGLPLVATIRQLRTNKIEPS